VQNPNMRSLTDISWERPIKAVIQDSPDMTWQWATQAGLPLSHVIMNVAVSTKSALRCRWLTPAAAQPPGILPHSEINIALYAHIINRWLTDEPPVWRRT